MKRRTAVILAALGCVIVGAFLWLLWAEERNSPVSQKELTESDGTKTVPLAPSAPSPVIRQEPETAQPKENKSPPTESGEAKKYNFITWHDALNEFVRLVGLEFDKIVQEDHPYPAVFCLQARRNAQEAMLNDPEFLAAMSPFIPHAEPIPDEIKHLVTNPNPEDRIPMKIWGNPIRLVVLSGRLPEESLYTKIALPNGKIFYLEENQQLRVAWQIKRPPLAQTEEGRRALENLRQREKQLEADVINAQGSAFDNAFAELERVKAEIRGLHKERITYRMMIEGVPDEFEDHPEFERIEMDLGVIERD